MFEFRKELKRNPKLEDELSFKYSKSSKPGGMKGDATCTKVTLKWNVLDSKIFDENEKRKIINYFKKYAKDKIDKEGEIIIYSEKERYQKLNKEDAINKLKELLNKALKPTKKRQPIQVSPKWHNARIKEKKIISEKKKLRRKITIEDLEELEE